MWKKYMTFLNEKTDFNSFDVKYKILNIFKNYIQHNFWNNNWILLYI